MKVLRQCKKLGLPVSVITYRGVAIVVIVLFAIRVFKPPLSFFFFNLTIHIATALLQQTNTHTHTRQHKHKARNVASFKSSGPGP